MSNAPDAIIRAAPPRLLLDVDTTFRLIQGSQSQDWNSLIEDAMTHLGLTADKVDELVKLLLTIVEARDNTGIRAAGLITLFTRMGVGENAARRYVKDRLIEMRNRFPQSDRFFAMNGGNLDARRFTPSKIIVFTDGVNDCLQGGDSPAHTVVRDIFLRLFRMVCDQLKKTRELYREHRSEEVTRIESVRELKVEIQAAIPALNSNSAQGYVRQFGKRKYDTLGICDGRTDGFKNAKDSLQSVATTQQLDRRSTNSVADNLTLVGKSVDALMNSTAANDLQLASARIRNEADPKKKKTMMWVAMTLRQQRWKANNTFAADAKDIYDPVKDIGKPVAQLNTEDQARYYLDQSAELERRSIAN